MLLDETKEIYMKNESFIFVSRETLKMYFLKYNIMFHVKHMTQDIVTKRETSYII